MVKLALHFVAALSSGTAFAAPSIMVTLQNHVFTPDKFTIAANKPAELLVRNMDDTVEEFESPGLKVEKVIPAKSELVVRIKPVAPGRYTFVGEYHEKTARGLATVE